jgi:hypothetical protein
MSINEMLVIVVLSRTIWQRLGLKILSLPDTSYTKLSMIEAGVTELCLFQ